jgi:hypothetical protein
LIGSGRLLKSDGGAGWLMGSLGLEGTLLSGYLGCFKNFI